ncbi:hypothetical protein LB561_09825 [Mesorhizobium sp. B292B1B]|uniref:hypothetical protein n=1 Tax=unclassified Mesorhizobium TaxID=325217 RepID=UPI00112CB807|nr:MULTISPECIES: hypothetical protein [unclassified Mesorhizobium]MCA0012909.1 hypothetical protein [Mesorhizobium sp. B294B1A1]MCA0037590.1 hypothetical protein [Mesorhizobium sp. B292B1B]TPM50697.1 hypothetical protein FJ964_02985 [Mesorhizobium sp. B2-3-2]
MLPLRFVAALLVRALSGTGKLAQFDFLDTRSTALNFESCNDNQASQGIISATSSWLVVTGVVGTFVQETITYPGGSGTIFPTSTPGKHKAILTTTGPAAAALITGSTSGATATVSSVTHPHALGDIRVYLQGEAHLFSDINVVGGARHLCSMRSATRLETGRSHAFSLPACSTVASRPGRRFRNLWEPNFKDAGSRIARLIMMFISPVATFEDCQWTNSWKKAVLSDTGFVVTQIKGGFVADFNRSNTANLPAIHFAGGSSGTVRDVVIGSAVGYSGNALRGVQIEVGCDVTLDNVDASLCTTPIVDSSGGTAKIRNCAGYKTRNRGTGTMPTGGSVIITHGLGAAPNSIVVTPKADPLVRYFVPTANITATSFIVACNAGPGSAWDFFWEASTASAA